MNEVRAGVVRKRDHGRNAREVIRARRRKFHCIGKNSKVYIADWRNLARMAARCEFEAHEERIECMKMVSQSEFAPPLYHYSGTAFTVRRDTVEEREPSTLRSSALCRTVVELCVKCSISLAIIYSVANAQLDAGVGVRAY
jgi:hypothetical protein